MYHVTTNCCENCPSRILGGACCCSLPFMQQADKPNGVPIVIPEFTLTVTDNTELVIADPIPWDGKPVHVY